MNTFISPLLAFAGIPTSLGLVLLLLFIGLIMLAVEAFVIPGFGVPGIMGLLFIAAGCAVAWIRFGPIYGMMLIIFSTFVVVAGGWLFFRSRAGRKLVLTTEQERSKGTESRDLSYLIGATGKAVTDLRPAGIALIEEERVDVATDGVYIEAGTQIEVVSIEGPRVTVARATDNEPGEDK